MKCNFFADFIETHLTGLNKISLFGEQLMESDVPSYFWFVLQEQLKANLASDAALIKEAKTGSKERAEQPAILIILFKL